jgi:hypothetical protein
LLKSVYFSNVDPTSISKIIDEMDFIAIRDNNCEMCRQGDNADIFYIIVSGTCQVTIDGKPVALLGAMDIFGENALFTDAKGRSRRGATVTTVTTVNNEIESVQLLALSRKKFNKLLVSGILNEDCVGKLKLVAETRKKENEQNNVGKMEVTEEQVGEKKTEVFVDSVGGSGSGVLTMAPDHKSDIETVRLLLKTKVRSLHKFSVIFRKMDKDDNGTLSRKQFKQLIHMAVKGDKELVDRLNLYFEVLWVGVCRGNGTHKDGGGGGGGGDVELELELDLDTAAKWLFH